LAAVNAHYCLVYFEQGGFGYSQRVTLFHLQNGRATMRWYAFRGGDFLSNEESLWTFPELRAALKHRQHQASAISSYPASVCRRNSS
jgi:hypothetical protein